MPEAVIDMVSTPVQFKVESLKGVTYYFYVHCINSDKIIGCHNGQNVVAGRTVAAKIETVEGKNRCRTTRSSCAMVSEKLNAGTVDGI